MGALAVHDPTLQSNSNTILSPVSMQGTRERSASPSYDHHSPHAHGPENGGHPDSEGADSLENPDSLSPRRGHTYKRNEEPPRNAQNKMICRYPECAQLTFDRKCEWSKHMDKHDRPYKCQARGCEKLQGFTYSGGLLRHEREVHKLHGGTRKALFCPFADCKRSFGTGFTRKENLAEHVRRVHRRTSSGMETDPALLEGGVGKMPPSTSEMEPVPVPVPVPVSVIDDRLQDAIIPTHKRKRSDAPVGLGGGGGGADGMVAESDLQEQVKRLKKEIEEKDDRLRKLEEQVRMLMGAGAGPGVAPMTGTIMPGKP